MAALIDLRQIKGGQKLQEDVGNIISVVGTEVIDRFVPTNSQVDFTLSDVPGTKKVSLIINGAVYLEGEGFFTVDRAGKKLTWVFNDAAGGFDMEDTFAVTAQYSVGINAPVLPPEPEEPKVAPTLYGDPEGNFEGSEVRITFTDNAAWRAAITEITIDGKLMERGFTTDVGRLAISVGYDDVPADGDIVVVVKATGYPDAQVTVHAIALQDVPSNSDFTLTPNPASKSQDLVISFDSAHAQWASKLESMNLLKDGGSTVEIAKGSFTTNSTSITIKKEALASAVTGPNHSINFNSRGYYKPVTNKFQLND